MLKLFEYDKTEYEYGMLAVLPDASEVKITTEINGGNSLEFVYPKDERSELATVNRIIVCEGQAYRISKVTSDSGGKITVVADHVYNTDAKRRHVPTIPDMIGTAPRDVLARAFEGTGFTLLTYAEAEDLGLKWVGSDGFLIDFFEVDKTSLFDVMETVIENCGKGELYIDNYKIALVERLGADTGMRLDVSRNMENITVQRDASELVTRLYPYGYNDTPILSVNGGKLYIDSPNTAQYGIIEGYRDYSDYEQPEDVYNHGLWEFDENNENRIDVPVITVSGSYIDLSKTADSEVTALNIGDGVVVMDGDVEIKERVTRIESYPYEPSATNITIGKVARDIFFYLDQLGKAGKGYKKASATNGDISAPCKYLSGTLNTKVNNIQSGKGNMSVVDDLMTVRDKNNKVRIRLGNNNGRFVFVLYNDSGTETITLDDGGNAEISGTLTADAVFSGTLKTDKDAEIGQFLKIKTVSGSAESGGIKFVASDGSTSGGIYQVENAGKVWIMANDVILGGVSINDLAARVETLEGGKA